MPRPDGYVRVSFAADKGLSLTEQKAYYVKANAKDAAGKPLTLGNTELVKPAYEAQTGYEFTKWDKEDSLEITNQDILVTAKAKVLADVDTVNHPNYVKVTFKAGANGVIKENGNPINEKVYYVNPNKYVNLKAPTPDGNTGYDFSTWKSDKSQSDFSLANFVNYKEDTTITAMFNQKDAVYPKLKNDGSDKPAGYVEVTFVVKGTNGKIADNEVKTYYVDPSREVSLKAPNTIAGTGFMFDGWRFEDNTTAQKINPADKKIYKKDTTIYGSFKKFDDIIPATNKNGTTNLQPVDYVAVLFIEGEHAQKLEGQALFYVNPKAGKTIGDLTQPKITPDTGWKYKGWDEADTKVINDYMFVVAQYEKIDDVIEKVDANTKKPDGYVTVTFKAGDNGKLDGITEKVYYVNPNVYVKLDAPNTVPDTGFVFGSWKSDGKVASLDNFIKYEKDTTITANFNLKRNIIPKTDNTITKPAGFVTVNFVIDPVTGGEIEVNQVITYFVKKGEAVTIHPPKTKADTGYEFDKWDKDTTVPTAYNNDVTTVKGSFKKLDDIIKSKEANGTINAKPEGYVTVQFLKGDHGVLDGQTTFYVNPKVGKTLNDLKPGDITIVPEKTYKFANWDKDLTTNITGDIDVTAKYTQLPNIIKAGPKDTAPAGYVVIIFETDGRGTITGNKAYEDKTNPKANENEIVYFVNPKKGIKLAKLAPGAIPTADQLAVPSTTPNDHDKYIFDQWRAKIDTTTPITRGRVHIATFKPKEVKLTYNANGATGDVPPELTVDYDTNVRLAGQGNLKKKDASFKGWKIGDKTYQAGDQINLKEDTTAYAQWTNDQNIIPYDPVHDPTTRPDDTYVRVTFAVEDGLKLTEQKAYYVKKDAGITLARLTKPTYDVKTGYKFDKWDKADTDTITADITVTAESTKLSPVVPEKTGETPNTKPDGYKEVVFVVKAEDMNKGSITGVNKFYVNPTEYVTITPPATKAETGFEFGAWDKDSTRPTVYEEDVTTITGSFNGLKDIIPNKNPDGTENKQPDGYKKVEFVIDPATGGSIVKDEITVYYVNPAKEVTVPQPKTLAEIGYEFDKWDQDTVTTPKMYTDDLTVKGNFKELEDIIPSTDNQGNANAKPDGYVTVTFDKGEHGTIKGQKVYYVNPKAVPVKTLAEITKPEVKAEVGYKFTGWNFADTKEILSNLTVIAQYKELDDVIPEKDDDGNNNTIPEGYIKVTFSTETNGKIKGTTDTTKVVYVNPNKALVLRPYAPEVTPNTGFDFANWDTQIDKRIQYNNNDVIKALYNAKGDVIPQERTDGTDQPAGYLKVMFAKGDHGELSGQTVYYVNPNKEVTVPVPTVTASIGWKQKTGDDAWDQKLTQKFTADTTITAQYTERDNIVPQEKTDGSDKPLGYITVTFKTDANGSLSGTTVYYVKPNVDINLTNKADNITKNPNVGYTAEGGTWKNSDSKNLKDTFDKDTEFVFNFAERPDVIKEKPGVTKPDGYVTVKFIPTNKATDPTEKVYFVNPLKEVTITEEPIGTKVKDANDVSYDYKFTGWTVTRGKINSWTGSSVSDKFIQDTDITAKYSVTLGNIMPLPLAKDNAVTAINDVPNAEDLIKNIPGSSTDPLPSGTTIKYATDGQPKVDQTGKTTARVEVTYPNGKTSIVTVPVTVVDNVVEQLGKDKPLVPDSYVKVTVDTTVTATDNTYFVKTFWVKPSTVVWIPVNIPTGKVEAIDGVMKTNNFINWLSDDDGKTYTTNITDEFTKEVTKITANYEFNKNIEPERKDPLWFSQYSKPEPKDFIKNVYNDNDPNKPGNLPPGTKFAFIDGIEPYTGEPGSFKTTIVVTYPNGEVTEKEVPYKVTGDVVEERPGETPTVPDHFVRVIVSSEELADGATFVPNTEPVGAVEKANDDSKFTRTFWVDSKKAVTIPVKGKEIVGIKDNADHRQWIFDYWQGVTIDKINYGDNDITGTFSALTPQAKDTTYYVLAKYRKADVPVPGSDYIVTDLNKLPTKEEYLRRIQKPTDPEKDIADIRVVKDPDVRIPGRTYAIIDVFYDDGTSARIEVQVYVLKPGETNFQIVYRDRIVEKEKIVEKIVKIKDNQRLKEVRFMQGFEGKFRPHDGLTRAEAAQILANALKQDGYNYNPAYPINYKDVKQKWYTQAIVITTQANVFKGYDDGYFRPEEKISRAEWIATLKRFQQLKDADGNKMGLKANHWATREVEAAYEEGWLQIYTNGNAKFNANEPITREEVAAVTNKAFGRLIDRTYIMRNDKSVINYKDINPSMWSYVDILCASNSFIHDENVYMSHGIEYIKTIVNNIEGTIIFNVQLKNLEIIQDKFQRYLR
nr:S-layer homology domain-containing protein [Ezakiella coagulans]